MPTNGGSVLDVFNLTVGNKIGHHKMSHMHSCNGGGKGKDYSWSEVAGNVTPPPPKITPILEGQNVDRRTLHALERDGDGDGGTGGLSAVGQDNSRRSTMTAKIWAAATRGMAKYHSRRFSLPIKEVWGWHKTRGWSNLKILGTRTITLRLPAKGQRPGPFKC